MRRRFYKLLSCCFVGAVFSCGITQQQKTDYTKALDYCVQQAAKTASSLTDRARMPRSIANGKKEWRMVDRRDWTAGFWPGIEWYLYEYTKD